MKAGLKINKILAAGVVVLAAPTAFAQTISVSDTNASINTAAHQVSVTIDRQGVPMTGFLFELDYDMTRLDLNNPPHTDPNVLHPRVSVVGTGAGDFNCLENVEGTLRCVTSNSITSPTFVVNISFTTLALVGVAPLTLDPSAINTNFVDAGFVEQPFVAIDNGTVTIQLAPANPTTINFNPTVVNLANGGATSGNPSAASIVAVTTGGAGVDPGSYSCTVPAGFQLTNAAGNNIIAGSDPADISVTCTLGAGPTQANSTCTRTGGADVVLTLNCPAAAGPVLSSAPPTGTALSCDGGPLSVANTQVTISNTGTADMTGVACITAGAGFSIQQAPAAVVAAGGSTPVVVACNVPAEGAPAIVGTLSCTTTAPAGGALNFPLSSQAATGAVPTQAATIPSTSLWAKIGLIGLLAVLGALVVGFRRHS